MELDDLGLNLDQTETGLTPDEGGVDDTDLEDYAGSTSQVPIPHILVDETHVPVQCDFVGDVLRRLLDGEPVTWRNIKSLQEKSPGTVTPAVNLLLEHGVVDVDFVADPPVVVLLDEAHKRIVFPDRN